MLELEGRSDSDTDGTRSRFTSQTQPNKHETARPRTRAETSAVCTVQYEKLFEFEYMYIALQYMINMMMVYALYRAIRGIDPGKSGLRLGQAVRAEGSASDVRVIAVRLVHM